MPFTVRCAEVQELDQLAKVWYDAWQDAHGEIVPAELRRIRTLESFRQRLEADLPSVRVVGPPGAPAGLCIVKDDELYQLFVAAQSRGSGVAAALVADAEALLAMRGVETAWLACAVGNQRAARFYEKCGWQRVSDMVYRPETPDASLVVNVWRYEKRLTRS